MNNCFNHRRVITVVSYNSVRRVVSILVFAMSIAAFAKCYAQSASPTPDTDTAIDKNGSSSQPDTTASSKAAAKKKQDDVTNGKKEKRGSFVIAPIPISSPAFGSGVLLVVRRPSTTPGSS